MSFCRVSTVAFFSRCNRTPYPAALQSFRAPRLIQDSSPPMFLCRKLQFNSPYYVDQLLTSSGWLSKPYYSTGGKTPSRSVGTVHCEICTKLSIGDASVTVNRVSISCEELGQTCLMWGKCSGSLVTQGRKLNWVICRKCQAWYHNVCVGLSPKLTTRDDFGFSCCAPPSPSDNIMYVPELIN